MGNNIILYCILEEEKEVYFTVVIEVSLEPFRQVNFSANMLCDMKTARLWRESIITNFVVYTSAPQVQGGFVSVLGGF